MHVRAVGLGHSPATQQIAAESIGDGQRVATFSIAAKKPSLEIRAPHLIRRVGVGQRLTVAGGPAALAACLYQPLPLQQVANTAGRRPLFPRFPRLQIDAQLPRPPARAPLAQCDHARRHVRPHRLRRVTRCPTHVLQPGFPFGLEPFYPLVPIAVLFSQGIRIPPQYPVSRTLPGPQKCQPMSPVRTPVRGRRPRRPVATVKGADSTSEERVRGDPAQRAPRPWGPPPQFMQNRLLPTRRPAPAPALPRPAKALC